MNLKFAVHGSGITPTDRAPAYPRVLGEQLPTACNADVARANNRIESDHSRLKARLRPMRGLKRLRSTQTISPGHALIQNIHRGHYELGTDTEPRLRPTTAFAELTLTI